MRVSPVTAPPINIIIANLVALTDITLCFLLTRRYTCMSRDKYKDQFDRFAASAFRNVYADVYKETGDSDIFSAEAIHALLEKPKDPKMGRFSFPVFRFASLLKDRPAEMSTKVAAEANRLLEASGEPKLVLFKGVGGFLNAEVDFETLAEGTTTTVVSRVESYGSSTVGRDRTVLVEYSSPNIAKPFGVGHLRTTVIGNSLRRIFKALGYNVVGINYPGDWGTQFGKMIVAYTRWGTESTLTGNAVANLLDLYVRFHREVEQDPSLDEEARRAFRRLEDGEPEAVRLWERLREISHAEFDRVYDLLGIEFDLVIGESFFNDKMKGVIERLQADGLTRISEGALIVDIDDPHLPPALLRKADGATLYITRDLAGMIYRWETYRFDQSLYVVGASQADHFKQCLSVIESMEKAERLPVENRMTGKIKHVGFGWVRFEKKSMSTRRGNIIFLEDVIDKAVTLARDIIMEKNAGLERIDETAHMIGTGAVIFSQLSVRRQKDVNFVWEEVLNFDGETGPYLQYTHARLCSLLRNYEGDITPDIDYHLLQREEETRVIEHLADFPEAVTDAAEDYEPYYVVSYLLRLAGAFNRMYQRKTDTGRIDKIISDDAALSAARIALVKAVQTVLKEGLYLLGMQAPDQM